MVNKRVWNAVLGCNLKNDRMISVRFQGKSFNITVIQVYAPSTNAEEAEVDWFSDDCQNLEPGSKKDVLFIIRDWDAKVGRQEIPWSNRQIWPWSTEWCRTNINRVLPRECTGHSKHPLPTTQESEGGDWKNLLKTTYKKKKKEKKANKRNKQTNKQKKNKKNN